MTFSKSSINSYIWLPSLLWSIFVVLLFYPCDATPDRHIRIAMLEGEMMIKDRAAIDSIMNTDLLDLARNAGYHSFKVTVLEDYETFKSEGDRNAYHFYKGSGFQYVQLEAKHAMLMSQYEGKPSYHASIIINKNITLKSLSDIKNYNYVFTSKHSASGYLYPRLFLADNGIYLEDFFASDIRSASQVVKAVSQGRLDVGFVYEGILLRTDLKPYTKNIREFKNIPHRIPADPFWVNEQFLHAQPTLCEAVASTLLAYENNKGDKYYTLTRTSDSEYETIRDDYTAMKYLDRFHLKFLNSQRVLIFLKVWPYALTIMAFIIIVAIFYMVVRIVKSAHLVGNLRNILKEKEQYIILKDRDIERTIEEIERTNIEIRKYKNDIAAAESLLEEVYNQAHVREGNMAARISASEKYIEELRTLLSQAEIKSKEASTMAIEKMQSTGERRGFDAHLQVLEALMRNYKLEPSANRDLKKLWRHKAALNEMLKHILDLDRFYPSVPSGMRMEKYRAGKDVFEIRVTDKCRFYICQGRKLLVRIDTSHEHGQISKWFKENSDY